MTHDPVGHVTMNCRYDTVYLLRDIEVFPFLHPHCTELEVREMEEMHKLARQTIQAKVGGFGGVIFLEFQNRIKSVCHSYLSQVKSYHGFPGL